MRWRGRNWLVVVAALFLCGLIGNVQEGGEHVVVNSIIQVSVIVMTLAAFFFLRREEIERENLLAFVRDNVEAIRAGTAEYRGQRLSYATRLCSYPFVMSFLVMSFALESRLVIGAEPARGLRLGCAVITVLFGPWGLPWGPIWSFRALVANVRGPRGTNRKSVV